MVPTREPSETERAYFAGFFDGEGSISPRKRQSQWKRVPGYYTRSYSFRVSITQVDQRPLVKLRECYGGILVFRDRSKLKNCKDVWMWALSGQAACRKFLNDIYPWIIVKRDAVDITLSALNMMQGRTGYRYTVQQHNVIVGAFGKLKARNKRGR